MKRHEFRIDADPTAEEGSNARCANCGMGVSSCLRKSDDGHLLEPVKVVTGWYINGGWHPVTPRTWTPADRRCKT